jgi:hypothetical protein
MRRTILTAALLMAILLADHPRVVEAREYPAWGDTGWMYGSKRECCKAAIAIAQQYSMEACLNLGGMPRPMRGGVARGSCESEWTQTPDGGILYRCVSESSVFCR